LARPGLAVPTHRAVGERGIELSLGHGQFRFLNCRVHTNRGILTPTPPAHGQHRSGWGGSSFVRSNNSLSVARSSTCCQGFQDSRRNRSRRPARTIWHGTRTKALRNVLKSIPKTVLFSRLYLSAQRPFSGNSQANQAFNVQAQTSSYSAVDGCLFLLLLLTPKRGQLDGS